MKYNFLRLNLKNTIKKTQSVNIRNSRHIVFSQAEETTPPLTITSYVIIEIHEMIFVTEQPKLKTLCFPQAVERTLANTITNHVIIEIH